MELVQTFRIQTKEIMCKGTETVRHRAVKFSVRVLAETETVNCPKCNKVFKVSDYLGIR